MITRRRCLAVLPSLGLAALVSGARAADPNTYSEAERLLFTQNQLDNLDGATQLDYEYHQRGSLQGDADDRAVVTVAAKRAGGGRDVAVAFLSGARKLDLPDVKDAEGNPIVLFFLEREVREMNRLTGGSSNYYRKRVRIALAEAAQVRTVDALVDGRTVQAKEVRFAPYREDPARSRYEKFAEKTFVLTLSEQVPGGVVELASELLAPAQAGKPRELLLGESLRYTGRH